MVLPKLLLINTISYCYVMGSNNGKPVLRKEDIAALSESSGMEEEKVVAIFDTFIAESPKGRMKPKEFREFMSKLCLKRTPVR